MRTHGCNDKVGNKTLEIVRCLYKTRDNTERAKHMPDRERETYDTQKKRNRTAMGEIERSEWRTETEQENIVKLEREAEQREQT